MLLESFNPIVCLHISSTMLDFLIDGLLIIIVLITFFSIRTLRGKQFYKLLVNNSLSGFCIVQKNRFVFMNRHFANMLGYKVDEIVGQPVSKFVVDSDIEKLEENIHNQLNHKRKAYSVSHYKGIHKEGHTVYIDFVGTSMIYKGSPAIIGTAIDVTERRQIEKLKEKLVYFDAFSNLPNFHFLEKKVSERMEASNAPFAFLVIRINNLRSIESTYGYKICQELLKSLIHRVKGSLGPSDVIVRHMDNKLLILLPQADLAMGEAIAQMLISEFNKPIKVENSILQLSSNIGICLYPETRTLSELIENGLMALRKSREKGINHYLVFSDEIRGLIEQENVIERDLSKAIANNELRVYYQPKVDLLSGEISGFEALMRWQHPIFGFIPPDVFIPIAERSGLIMAISEWLLREVCLVLNQWRQDAKNHSIRISINLSPLQMLQPELVQSIKNVITETGCDPFLLEFEITESFALEKSLAVEKLSEFKRMGIHISLDDFGTGYSSLSQINDLPLDKIKIDQSFIRNRFADLEGRMIISTILAMAKGLQLIVVAEGVETIEQLIFLQENGCDEAQGYLFSRPRPLEEILKGKAAIEKIVHNYGRARLSNLSIKPKLDL
ncbi:sensor domain-containing protein [Pullulanibacillus pueri]|uniref:Uncharacterized protein n=1 Tax=Pullulanibacillus pueri TaxID=1437324 RepID=A0A8J2ZT89_9BACL|nr:GGDEF domain-containing phosphodiesterase [Pullulanibacillus pueri]GGH76668.1 hypothetical protein GCM10007096_07440 [Pullulanibacillus pueri]